MKTPTHSHLGGESHVYEDSRLIRMWRDWLAAAERTALDKWLKQYFRESVTGKSGRAALSIEEQAELTQAMNNALRFQQLACALEFLFQEYHQSQKIPAVNWLAWDEHWNISTLQNLPISNFWYWIQLRVTGNGAKKNLAHLQDVALRRDFFKTLLATNYFDEAEAAYLWVGLRPQWRALINERASTSQWDDVQLKQFLALQTSTPPLWLRTQSDLPIETICEQLIAQGVNAKVVDRNLSAHGGRGITSTELYKAGAIEIQDLASQSIAQAAAVKPGQKVWDACAGAGGKTLAIAARMANKGALVATDLHEYKLEELKRRAKRAGVFNTRTFAWDGTQPLRLPKEVAQQQGFDWVLVDAPCSSSGTWRRNPDARWRLDETDTCELLQLQQRLLRNAAPAVRTNGALVYATCSWQVSENEEQVSWFLQNHPQFELQYQRMLGAPALDADTMFVAVLVNRGV